MLVLVVLIGPFTHRTWWQGFRNYFSNDPLSCAAIATNVSQGRLDWGWPQCSPECPGGSYGNSSGLPQWGCVLRWSVGWGFESQDAPRPSRAGNPALHRHAPVPLVLNASSSAKAAKTMSPLWCFPERAQSRKGVAMVVTCQSMSNVPRPQTKPSINSPPNGSCFHRAGCAGTTSVWPTSLRVGAPGLVPGRREITDLLAGAASKTSMSAPQPWMIPKMPPPFQQP